MFIFRCVIVLLHPKKNRQTHIINTSRYVSLLEPLKSSASLAADVMRFTCVVFVPENPSVPWLSLTMGNTW